MRTALDHECPTCKAKPGAPCVSTQVVAGRVGVTLIGRHPKRRALR